MQKWAFKKPGNIPWGKYRKETENKSSDSFYSPTSGKPSSSPRVLGFST
jgi:hypothetical protein